jgi:hypothetical protein
MNPNEKKIFEKYERLGYEVIKDGLPDLVILKNGKLEFVEVKYKFDRLNPNQQRAFALLKKHRIPVRMERVAEIRTSQLLEKWRKEVKNNEM